MMWWALTLAASGAEPEPEPIGSRWEFGRDVRIGVDQRADEVVVVGGDIEVEGRVDGNALAIGGDIRVEAAGRVSGDGVSIGGEVTGRVDGDRVAILGSPGTVAEPPSAPIALARSIYQQIVWLLVVASAAVLVTGIFPGHVRRVAEHVEAQPLRTTAVGLVVGGFVIVFSGMFPLLTFGVGAAVSVVLIAMLLAAWLLGIVALAHTIGTRVELGRTARTQWMGVLFGIVTVGLLTLIPVLGTVVFVVASGLALGAVVTTWFGPDRSTEPLTRS